MINVSLIGIAIENSIGGFVPVLYVPLHRYFFYNSIHFHSVVCGILKLIKCIILHPSKE